MFCRMLTAISTAHDAGIAIYGDYNDLESLHDTIHHLCDHPNVEQHLAEFAPRFRLRRTQILGKLLIFNVSQKTMKKPAGKLHSQIPFAFGP